MATIKTTFGTVNYPETVGSDDREVQATVWEKDGKCRVYFKVLFTGSRPVECGFICCVTGNKAIRSTPVSWGHRIEAATSIEKI